MRYLFLNLIILMLSGCFGPGINPGNETKSPGNVGRKNFLFASGVNKISSFDLQGNGSLVLKSNIFSSGLGDIRVHPSGKFLYIAPAPGTTIHKVYSINTETGELTTVNDNITLTDCPDGKKIAIDGTGKYLYVSCEDGKITGYSLNPSTGEVTITPVSKTNIPTAGSVGEFSTSGSGLYLHATTSNKKIESFEINSTDGTLSPLGDSVGYNTLPNKLVTILDQFLYWCPRTNSTLEAFSIASNGKVSPLANTPFNITGMAKDYQVTGDGNFLYTIQSTGELRGYGLTNGGSPAELTSSPFTESISGGAGLEIDPSGQFAFVGDETNKKIYSFTVNKTTGLLTELPNPVSFDGAPLSLWIY